MDLVIDKGNTRTKYAVFKSNSMQHKGFCETTKLGELLQGFAGGVSRLIFCSVTPVSDELRMELQKCCSDCVILSSQTALPFANKYGSPESLGSDRIALVAGAIASFPESNVLVVDLGSCMTFDFIDKGSNYLGGSISLGMMMRFKALSEFTAKLPLIPPETPKDLIGNNTKQSILSGVVGGMVNEIDGTIDAYKRRYSKVKIILTGGDLSFFDKKLKNSIFADDDILLNGMHFILKNYANKKI